MASAQVTAGQLRTLCHAVPAQRKTSLQSGQVNTHLLPFNSGLISAAVPSR